MGQQVKVNNWSRNKKVVTLKDSKFKIQRKFTSDSKIFKSDSEIQNWIKKIEKWFKRDSKVLQIDWNIIILDSKWFKNNSNCFKSDSKNYSVGFTNSILALQIEDDIFWSVFCLLCTPRLHYHTFGIYAGMLC